MKTIGLDLDGVLYEWHDSVYEFFKLYRNYCGTYVEFWTDEWKKIPEDTWTYITSIDILYSNKFPTDDCKNFIEKIKDNFEIYYITSRPDSVKTTTELYLNRFKFPFVDNLIFTHDKENMARKLSLSYAIDDYPKHVENLSKVTNIIMRARPWNMHLWGLYPTVHSLSSALSLMEIK